MHPATLKNATEREMVGAPEPSGAGGRHRPNLPCLGIRPTGHAHRGLPFLFGFGRRAPSHHRKSFVERHRPHPRPLGHAVNHARRQHNQQQGVGIGRSQRLETPRWRLQSAGDRSRRPTRSDHQATAAAHQKKPRAFARQGLFRQDEPGKSYLLVRVPTTSTSTRRFLARPSLVALSATGWPSPLPSV